MRATKLLWILPATVLLGVGTAVWATTHHKITVDGKILDFSADEKTKGDPKGDSAYANNNDLTTLYVTWDAKNLYIGFEYAAWNAAVMYLVDTGKKGGVGDFCPSVGYKGAFPANIKGSEFDLMVAMWLAPDIVKQPTPFVYLLGSKTSQDITMNSGVNVSMKDTGLPKVPVHQGVVEAVVPWNALYGLGSGKVPKGAKLKIAGVLRGKQNGDGVGDVSPNCTGTVSGKPCGSGPATTVDKFHEVLVDGDCDGLPDKGCKPGQNFCPGGKGAPCPTKKDAGPPPPDKTAWPDKTPAPDKMPWAPDKYAWPDKTPWPKDQGKPADLPKTTDKKVKDDYSAPPDTGKKQDGKIASKDINVVVDAPVVDAILGEGSVGAEGKKTLQTEDGCACSAQGSQSMSMGLVGLGLLALVGVGRRRRD